MKAYVTALAMGSALVFSEWRKVEAQKEEFARKEEAWKAKLAQNDEAWKVKFARKDEASKAKLALVMKEYNRLMDQVQLMLISRSERA